MPKGTPGRSICTIEGCGRPHEAHGLCNLHYLRLKHHGTTDSRRVRLGLDTRVCSVESCEKTVAARGLCACHDWRMRVHGSLDDPRRSLSERFWEKVNKDGPVPAYAPELGPCWIWTAFCLWNGYGRFGIDGHTEYAVTIYLTHHEVRRRLTL